MVCTTGGMRTQTARLNEAAPPPFPVVVGVGIRCLLLLLVVVLSGFRRCCRADAGGGVGAPVAQWPIESIMGSSRQHSDISSNSTAVVDLLTAVVVTFFFVHSTNENERDSGTDCCFLSFLPGEEKCIIKSTGVYFFF